MNAVEFQGGSKSYAIYNAPGDRLKELLAAIAVYAAGGYKALADYGDRKGGVSSGVAQ